MRYVSKSIIYVRRRRRIERTDAEQLIASINAWFVKIAFGEFWKGKYPHEQTNGNFTYYRWVDVSWLELDGLPSLASSFDFINIEKILSKIRNEWINILRYCRIEMRRFRIVSYFTSFHISHAWAHSGVVLANHSKMSKRQMCHTQSAQQKQLTKGICCWKS